MSISLRIKKQANIWGAAASTLCLIHCLATPFLFAAHTVHLHENYGSPSWWGLLDVVFITISFLAVFWSVRNTSKKWMKWALWLSWAMLAGILLNEKLLWVPIAEEIFYAPSVALVVLHLYNRKFCQCENGRCCIHKPKNSV